MDARTCCREGIISCGQNGHAYNVYDANLPEFEHHLNWIHMANEREHPFLIVKANRIYTCIIYRTGKEEQLEESVKLEKVLPL